MAVSILAAVIFVAVGSVVGSFAQTPSNVPASTPVDFAPTDGGFRIKFPAPPKPVDANGSGVPQQFALTKGGIVYFVSYQDYPQPITAARDIKSVFEVAKTQALSDGEKLLSERELTADGAAGHEFVTEDAKARLTTRIFLAGHRVFKLIAGIKRPAATGPAPNQALALAFLDSFHLISKPVDRTAYATEPADAPVLGEGTRGTVEAGMYRNDILALTMVMPDGWQVIDEKQFNYANSRGSRSAGGSGIDDSVDRSLRNTANLVAVSKYAFGTPRNATLVMSLERLAAPGVTAQTVANSALSAMKAELPLRVTKDVYLTRAGGTEFASFTTALDLPDGVFRQSYFVTIRRGQALTIVFSYVFDEDGLSLEKSLLSIRFAGRS
jgi:hypothetical protein